MIFVNCKLVELTDDEAFDYYLNSGSDDLMSFNDYKLLLTYKGVNIVR